MLFGTLILFILTLISLYWFRYTCLWILRTRNSRDYSRVVAEANGLSFVENSRRLQSESRETLDIVRRALRRDYQLVCCLLRHSTGLGDTASSFRQALVRADYVVLDWLYPVASFGSGYMARYALLEMASIIGYLAHSMGERSAALSRA